MPSVQLRVALRTHAPPLMLFACTTDVHMWRTAHTAFLDRALVRNGFRLLPLSWSSFELLDGDRDHFTWEGFCTFASALVSVLQNQGVVRVHVFADSTIDHDNWSPGWEERHDAAHKHLALLLAEASIAFTLDSWSGSGFCQDRTFAERARGNVRPGWDVLVVGGWNDSPCSRANVASGVRKMVRACCASPSREAMPSAGVPGLQGLPGLPPSRGRPAHARRVATAALPQDQVGARPRTRAGRVKKEQVLHTDAQHAGDLQRLG